ncbi:MAG: hypothetical protein GYA02_10585 [Clostridiaceae bacterium]|jgi:small-conductance mechanosensitive channel|nr:hypothetical protein [Clostridiaceae bacterium]
MSGSISDNDNKSCNNLWQILFRSLLSVIALVPLLIFISVKFNNYLDLYHTVLELIFIFIALFAFFFIWLNYEKISSCYRMLGYGCLMIALFDLLHTFYFLGIDSPYSIYIDYSIRFWIISRFTQVIVLLIYVRQLKISEKEAIRISKHEKS